MRVKLLYVPRRYGVRKHEYRQKHAFMPPLGISVLTASLRDAGFAADHDDLDVKVFFENWDTRPEVKYDLAGFDDSGRIMRFLETGHDEQLEREAERMLSLTKTRRYDVIGLSTCGQQNFSTVGVALVMAKLIKEKYDSTIILGGIDASGANLPQSVVESPQVDFIVTGHGDAPLLNLCHAIEHGVLGSYPLHGVLPETGVHSTGHPPYHQGDRRFYLPAFDGLPLDLYRYHPLKEFSKEEVGHLLSSRSILMLPYYFMIGCPFNCAFCGESYSREYTVKPVEEIVDDLRTMKRRYHASHFFFLNDMVNPSKEFVQSFSGSLIKADLDLRWSDCAHFAGLNRDLLASLRAAGAVRLIFGLETASARLLRYVRKSFTLSQASEVLKCSHELGIWNEIELVCGLPTERPEDIAETERFIQSHARFINYCHPNRFQLKRSLFLKEPALFSLQNISRIDHPYHAYRFDESKGLSWEKKEEEIQRSYDRMEAFVGQHIYLGKGMRFYRSNENLPFLFYLYEIFEDKSMVEAVIHDRWEARMAARDSLRRHSPLMVHAYAALHRVRGL